MKNKPYRLSGNIIDVVNRKIIRGWLHITAGKITDIRPDEEATGPFLMPGLIDAHIHIESSMLIPSEFARIAVVHGTVAAVSDPHEIANVLGIDGVHFMIANGSQVPFKFYFGAPSCVPATNFETSGGCIGLEETENLLKMPEIHFLSEMMNFPGVLARDPLLMDKLALAEKYDKVIDGHAPGLRGEQARQYAEAGISTDHECYTLDEAREKLTAGMHILIREGSAAKNFDELIPLLTEAPEHIMLCSDDKHPDDLVAGHINLLLKRGIEKGYDLFDLLQSCTLNPVRHYGLDAGLLQVGDAADLIMVEDLTDFKILATIIDGTLVAADGECFIPPVNEKKPNRFHAKKIAVNDLWVDAGPGMMKVQIAFDGQLITGCKHVKPRTENGRVVTSVEDDLLKLMVMNRYQPSKPAVGFIHNFGLKRGAIASSVAHDSHNIIAVGVDDADIVGAVNRLIEERGGLCVAAGDECDSLPLPVGGIMSTEDAFAVAEKYKFLDQKAKSLGCTLNAPFMTLSFMSLLVIPSIKLSDRGLFDGNSFQFTGLFD